MGQNPKPFCAQEPIAQTGNWQKTGQKVVPFWTTFEGPRCQFHVQITLFKGETTLFQRQITVFHAQTTVFHAQTTVFHAQTTLFQGKSFLEQWIYAWLLIKHECFSRNARSRSANVRKCQTERFSTILVLRAYANRVQNAF